MGMKSFKYYMVQIINVYEDSDVEILCVRSKANGKSFMFQDRANAWNILKFLNILYILPT